MEQAHAHTIKRIKNLVCACLILLILLWMAMPFFPKAPPSQEQMAFANALGEEGAVILERKWKSCVPFLGCKQVDMWLILPDDVSFESWHTNTFRKIGAKDIEETHESVTAVARTRKDTTVQIQAKSRQQVVRCQLTFR